MQESVIITTRRDDASLVARLTLDAEPDKLIGDDLLDRVASVLNSAAADLNVASVEVFPPAIVADRALLEGWSRTIPNIEGNACFTRPRRVTGQDCYAQDCTQCPSYATAFPSPAVSEPVSEPISGAISEPKSEPKSGHVFADLEAILAELTDAGVPAGLEHPGFISVTLGELEWGLDDWGWGPANTRYRICLYEHNELTQGNADPYSIEYFGDNELGRSEAIRSFAEHYHEARREAEGVLESDEADAALADAIKALEPSAEQWHTGGGCYAVQAETPLGLFITVATTFPPAVVTYANASVEDFDLADDDVTGAWLVEQAVAEFIHEESTEFTPARIEAFAAEFAAQFAWASKLEFPDITFPENGYLDPPVDDEPAAAPAPIGGGREHDDVRRILAELEENDCTLVALAKEPGDEPFWTVLALRRKPVFPAAPYAVWDFAYSGLSSGHYDLTRSRAFEVFNEHVARRED